MELVKCLRECSKNYSCLLQELFGELGDLKRSEINFDKSGRSKVGARVCMHLYFSESSVSKLGFEGFSAGSKYNPCREGFREGL